MNLFTKNGKPLQISEDIVYSKSGKVVGRIKDEKVFGKNGYYVGTIVGDRLVFRSNDSASISSTFNAANHVGTARANHVGSAIYGDEPDIPD